MPERSAQTATRPGPRLAAHPWIVYGPLPTRVPACINADVTQRAPRARYTLIRRLFILRPIRRRWHG